MNDMGSVLAWLISFAIWVVCVALYIVNVFKLVTWEHSEITFEFVLRVIGVFVPPLGSIMGIV